ncbi:MAG: AHH domain-containing protein [Myxococcota bacterium]
MSDNEHVAKLSDRDSHDKGCVTKHVESMKDDPCSYRKSGYDESKTGTSQKGRDKRAIYEVDFTEAENAARLPRVYQEHKIGQKKTSASLLDRKDPRADKEAWWFTDDENFKNAFTPYNHNHHHIMPWASIKHLDEDELDIIQEGGYNLNDKDNMILLPCLLAYGIALQLPDHPYGHTGYNREVKQIVNRIKAAINIGREGHEITSDNTEDFRQALVDWQKEECDLIIDAGESIAADFLAGKPVPKNQVNKVPMASTPAPPASN